MFYFIIYLDKIFSEVSAVKQPKGDDKMNEGMQEKLVRKIIETYPCMTMETALKRAENLLKNTNDKLMVNLFEWVNDKKISDIWIGDYCVKMVMEIRGDNKFLDAIEALVLYSQNPKAGLTEIWRTKK